MKTSMGNFTFYVAGSLKKSMPKSVAYVVNTGLNVSYTRGIQDMRGSLLTDTAACICSQQVML
jgi:hypothetical protein